MHISKFIALSLALVWSSAAFSQSVSSRVTGAAGGAAASATAGAGGAPAASADNPFSAMNSSTPGSAGNGGDWNGGVGVKMGGKTVILKGGVGVEENRGNFRAGAAVPF